MSRLLIAATTIAAAVLIAVCAIYAQSMVKPIPIGAPEQLQLSKSVYDRDLLTQEEKLAARESGVADYWLNGVHYVDYILPSYYWEDDYVIKDNYAIYHYYGASILKWESSEIIY